MTCSWQSDIELYFEVRPGCNGGWSVVHKVSGKQMAWRQVMEEATQVAEDLTAEAHRESEELLA